MNIIDISNWTINEIKNSIDTFKDTSLTDIGMVNCDIESINIVGEVTTATLWINEDIGIDEYTGTAPLKIYKEDKIEIKLNSLLLEGDTIEVVDGKLCHVHRYNSMVLDGSENWNVINVNNYGYIPYYCLPNVPKANAKKVNSDRLKHYFGSSTTANEKCISGASGNGDYIFIFLEDDINIIEYLSSNPLTIIYEIADFIYENITPLQSEIVLKTFEECNMNIVTNLPIKTNVSYRTNVPSISTLSNRVAEVSESDSVIQNLIDIIDDEVDE